MTTLHVHSDTRAAILRAICDGLSPFIRDYEHHQALEAARLRALQVELPELRDAASEPVDSH